MLSLDPQINNLVFSAIHVSVRTHEVFSEHGPKCLYLSSIIYVFSREIKHSVLRSRNQIV